MVMMGRLLTLLQFLFICGLSASLTIAAGVSPTPQVGVSISFEALQNETSTVSGFLKTVPQLLGGNREILQFYVLEYDSPASKFDLFATFADLSDLEAALTDGQNVLQKFIPDTKKYLTGSPTITPLQIVTSKQEEGFVSRGLRATVEAQPDKVTQLIAKFKSLLPLAQAESFTPQWYPARAYNVSGPTDTFITYDFSPDQSGINAHLLGNVTSTFMASAPDLLVAGVVDIQNVSVIAERLL